MTGTKTLLLALVGLVLLAGVACAGAEPTPTTTPRPQPTATATPIATPTATPTPRPGETPVVRPTPTPTPVPTPTPGVTIKRGGILRMPWKEAVQWDTHQSTIYDALVTINTNNHLITLDWDKAEIPQPDLARSWDVSQDGTRITFKLREGVRFHDGKALTCDDVQYSYQRIMTPPTGMVSIRRATLEPVKSVSCLDATTVVFELKNPWPDGLTNIANPFNIIFPKHVAEVKDKAGEFMKRTVIGTGPFVFKRYVVGEIVELQANRDYWRAGLPYLDGLQFYPTVEDRTFYAGFAAGRFDYMFQLDSAPLAKEAAEKAGDKWTIKEYPRNLPVNFMPDMKEGSIWQDVDVRRAASLAVCRSEFLQTMGPLAFMWWSFGLLPQTSTYALPEQELRQVPGYGTDCAAQRTQARDIFKRKGLEGYKLEIYTWATVVAFRDSSIVVCDALKKVGLDCTVKALEQGPYYEMVDNRRIPKGMAVVHSIGLPATTPDGILGEAFHPGGARNYGVYEDQKLRDLFAQQSRELDQAKRKEMLLEYQRRFLDQQYHVILGWRGTSKGWWNYVQGAAIRATNPIALWWPMRFDEVWLDR